MHQVYTYAQRNTLVHVKRSICGCRHAFYHQKHCAEGLALQCLVHGSLTIIMIMKCVHDLSHFRTTAARLEKLMNFTINCTSDMPTLECSVDEGFAPALDSLETTYCTFKNTMCQTIGRKQCELYHRVYIRKGYSGLKLCTREEVEPGTRLIRASVEGYYRDCT